MTAPATTIVPLATVDPAATEALLDRAFGPHRHGRTAYRVRAGVAQVDAMSFAALLGDGTLAGSIQCWPVLLACDGGGTAPLVMVGPVAVEPHLQQHGLGRALMRHMLDRADALGLGSALMLVGDPEYYGRWFGFSADRTGGWRLPGPYEAHRVLARGDAVPACTGLLGPRLPVAA